MVNTLNYEKWYEHSKYKLTEKGREKRTTQQHRNIKKHVVFVGLCNADSSAFPQPSPLQDAAYYTSFFTIQKRIFVGCQVPTKLKKIFFKECNFDETYGMATSMIFLPY